MVSYSIFSQAFRLTSSCKAESEYIQACMDTDLDIEKSIQKKVYMIAKMSWRERREKILGISRAEMHRQYGIPLRTLEDWEAGKYKPADYVESLLAYTLL